MGVFSKSTGNRIVLCRLRIGIPGEIVPTQELQIESSTCGAFYPIAGHEAKCHIFRGQAAATASKSQLKINNVPPVGAAKGKRPCPAYWRSVRSPAKRLAANTNPEAAKIPIPACTRLRSASAIAPSAAEA